MCLVGLEFGDEGVLVVLDSGEEPAEDRREDQRERGSEDDREDGPQDEGVTLPEP